MRAGTDIRGLGLLGAAIALLAPGLVRAEGDEQGFSWHPSVTLTNVYDDNPGLTDADSTDDIGIWFQPRFEIGYRGSAFEVGADLGYDLRRYTDDSTVSDQFYNMRAWAEAGLLPGLTLRLSDDFVPLPRALGRPEFHGANLIQTQRADLEVRYWRELPRGLELEAGATGSHFLTEEFDGVVTSVGGVPIVDEDYHADFWQGVGFLQLQMPVGSRSSAYVLGQYGYREFDSSSRADHGNASVLVGFRSLQLRRLEIELSVGYGLIDFYGLSDEHQPIGQALLRYRLPGDWAIRAEGGNRFRSNLVGNEVFEANAELAIEKRFGEKADASLVGFFARFDDEGVGLGSDWYAGGGLDLGYQLTTQVRVGLSYRYWTNQGSDTTDDFDQNHVGLTFRYRY